MFWMSGNCRELISTLILLWPEPALIHTEFRSTYRLSLELILYSIWFVSQDDRVNFAYCKMKSSQATIDMSDYM